MKINIILVVPKAVLWLLLFAEQKTQYFFSRRKVKKYKQDEHEGDNVVVK